MTKKKKCKNIFKAIDANNIEAVKAFLPEQLELIEDIFDSTPLNWACQYGYIEIVRLLLDYGANIEACGGYGNTPLYTVCHSGNIEIASLLLDKGANINVRDIHGWTPLHKACAAGHTETSELLVRRGADPLALNYDGMSALDCDGKAIRDKSGNIILHKEILIQLRAEYLNKHALEAAKTTAALSSGWEMEM